MTKVLAISGSLRRASYNTGLLRAVAAHAPEDVEVEIYADLKGLAPFDEDDEANPPASVVAMRDKVRAADALLIATPEYNTTLPGQLKHLIDWCSRPYGPEAALYSKPVAVIGASATDYGAIWAQDVVRKAVGLAGGRVTEGVELAVGAAASKFDENGELTDSEIAGRLAEVLDALVSHHKSLA